MLACRAFLGVSAASLVVAVFAAGCRGEEGNDAPEPPPAVATATDDDFDDIVIEQSRTRPVIVMFTARWSGPDRVLEPIVRDAIEARRGRVRLALVDVDRSPSSAARYEVLSIPTLMAFADGKPLGRRRVGALPRARIDEYLDAVERRAAARP